MLRGIYDKLLVTFPFLRFTVPFRFTVDKSVGRCVVLLERISRPRTWWRLIFSYYLEIEIEPIADDAVRFHIEKWGNRQFFLELDGYLKSATSATTLVDGSVSGERLTLAFLVFVAVLQLFLAAGFAEMRSFLMPLLVAFWSIGLFVNLIFQRWEIHRLITLIRNTLNN